jgi:hypothetical protein
MIPTDPTPRVANMTLSNYTLLRNPLKSLTFPITP